MADIRMTLTGTRAGVMPPRRDQKPDGMPVIQFEYEVVSPRDAASGQASGRRIHHPLKVVHEVNEWSPFLLPALVTNELFSSVIVEFFKTEDGGRSIKYYEIRITHVNASSLRQFTENDQFLEELQFTFQTIEETQFPTENLGSDSIALDRR
jgi:type VI secretion system secreted protein Hcp